MLLGIILQSLTMSQDWSLGKQCISVYKPGTGTARREEAAEEMSCKPFQTRAKTVPMLSDGSFEGKGKYEVTLL